MPSNPSNSDPDAIPVVPDAGGDLHAIRIGREAMACRFEVVFNAGQHPMATAIAFEALDLVDAVEARLTVYRDTSEVARLNRTAAADPQPVAEDLMGLLLQCRRLHERTEGAFDPAVGRLLRAWGFHRRAGRVPDPESLAEAISNSGMRHVELDEAARTVRFDRDGIELNFGAIGKGWAVDLVVDLLAERLAGGGGPHLLVHGGSSSARAVGHQASLSGAEGWVVGLVHPLRPTLRLATFRLRDRALGTSGSGTQFFIDRGRRLGHVLDPRRGAPAEGVLSATVVAPTAADADALATALHVLGPEGLPKLAPRGGDVAAVLVMPGRSAAGVRLLTANVEEDLLAVADRPGIERVEAV